MPFDKYIDKLIEATENELKDFTFEENDTFKGVIGAFPVFIFLELLNNEIECELNLSTIGTELNRFINNLYNVYDMIKLYEINEETVRIIDILNQEKSLELYYNVMIKYRKTNDIKKMKTYEEIYNKMKKKIDENIDKKEQYKYLENIFNSK